MKNKLEIKDTCICIEEQLDNLSNYTESNITPYTAVFNVTIIDVLKNVTQLLKEINNKVDDIDIRLKRIEGNTY